jgi:hypothetical protein
LQSILEERIAIGGCAARLVRWNARLGGLVATPALGIRGIVCISSTEEDPELTNDNIIYDCQIARLINGTFFPPQAMNAMFFDIYLYSLLYSVVCIVASPKNINDCWSYLTEIMGNIFAPVVKYCTCIYIYLS